MLVLLLAIVPANEELNSWRAREQKLPEPEQRSQRSKPLQRAGFLRQQSEARGYRRRPEGGTPCEAAIAVALRTGRCVSVVSGKQIVLAKPAPALPNQDAVQPFSDCTGIAHIIETARKTP